MALEKIMSLLEASVDAVDENKPLTIPPAEKNDVEAVLEKWAALKGVIKLAAHELSGQEQDQTAALDHKKLKPLMSKVIKALLTMDPDGPLEPLKASPTMTNASTPALFCSLDAGRMPLARCTQMANLIVRLCIPSRRARAWAGRTLRALRRLRKVGVRRHA